MRDKVKRFISILMTALMLVNLLPVGALAEGVKISNSVQSKVSLTADSGTAPIETGHVYVYVKIDGASSETLAKFKLNSSGWYTIGSIAKTMPGKGEWEPYWYGGGEWVITPTPSDTKTYQPGEYAGTGELPAYSIVGLKPWEDNKLIPLGNVRWTGYKLTTGANNYQPESIFSWHMDGIVNFKEINVPYTVKHVVKKSSPEIVLKEETKNQKYGQWTEAQALKFEGYKHVGEIVNQEIGDDPITIYVYYEPDKKQTVDVTYKTSEGGTIKNGGTYKIQPVTGNLSGGGRLPSSTPTANAGYEFAGWERDDGQTYNDLNDVYSKLNQKTADAGTYTLYQNTTFTAKFKPKTNLSYTVKYLEKGTNKKLHDEKTASNKTFGDVVDPKDEVIGINGYNYDSASPETLTIGTDDNVLTLYYTKRTDLSYTVKYLEKGTNKKLHDEKTASNKTFGDVVDPKDEVIGINGYNYDSASPETLTIQADESKNVINLYYTKKTDLSYTVNYLEKGTTNVLHEAKTVENQTFGAEITSASEKIDISGYNYDSASPETLTIQADESKNVINLYYTKKTDLSYTVNYYWNGTNPLIPIKNSESGTETYGKTVNPDTDVPGYTLVPGQTTSLEIKDDPDQPNVLNLYYYKNVKLKANDTSRVYNGAKQTILSSEEYTVITTLDNQVVETTFDKEINVTGSGTDVGSNYTMYFPKKEIGIHNEQYYVVGYENGKLSITKRPVTLTSGSAERVYNGEALTKKEVTASTGENEGFVKGQGATYDVTGSQTDVGESKNTFTYKLNGNTNANNYSIELVLGKLEVTPVTAEVIVTITGRTDEMPYDGKEHSVFGYDVTVSNTLYNPKKDMQFNGIDEDMTAKGIDAGTYPMELTAEYFTNKSKNFSKVTFVVTDGYVKITPRAVTLTSASASKVYDGTALEKPVVTVGGDGFVEGQVKEIKATGSVTNAGSVANTITFTPNKETFKDGNYAIAKTEGTLTIAKRSVLITSQSATKTYDGSALTRPAVTITGDGFVPGELAKAEATGSITNVGSTPNAIQYTTTGAFNAANYSIALSVGTLTVTEKPKPEPRRTFNLTINYVYQNGKRAAASYNRGGLKNGETFDITSPVIAGYTASETVVSGTIYNRDIKVTVIYTADGVNLDDYGVPLGLGNITMNVGDCFE
jgi:hypothetical protein